MTKQFPPTVRAASSLLLIAALAACGGAENSLADRFQLRATVSAAEDSLPFLNAEGLAEGCIYLYVQAFVQSESGLPLPRDFGVSRIALSREGSSHIVWQAETVPRESWFISPTNFTTLAKSCTAGFATKEKVKVILSVHGDGAEDEVEVSIEMEYGNS